MESRQTISAVAARTGFAPSDLRLYEDAGLIKRDRTDAGYRVYDDRSVERLRFVSRAKQLGLSLDEITELVALGDLQRFRNRMAAADASGSCGDRCACQADPVASAPLSLTAKPVNPIDSPPIACSLAPAQMGRRVTDWQGVLSRATDGPTPVDGGVAIRFGRDAELAAEVSALAAAEQSCCRFFAFIVRMDHTGTELTVTAPADARPLVEALFGVPA
jgi:DNA-binding transcriptional MerR regulator